MPLATAAASSHRLQPPLPATAAAPHPIPSLSHVRNPERRTLSPYKLSLFIHAPSVQHPSRHPCRTRRAIRAAPVAPSVPHPSRHPCRTRRAIRAAPVAPSVPKPFSFPFTPVPLALHDPTAPLPHTRCAALSLTLAPPRPQSGTSRSPSPQPPTPRPARHCHPHPPARSRAQLTRWAGTAARPVCWSAGTVFRGRTPRGRRRRRRRGGGRLRSRRRAGDCGAGAGRRLCKVCAEALFSPTTGTCLALYILSFTLSCFCC